MARRKKKKTKRIGFPKDCNHQAFFGCKKPNKCLGCYYNPIKADAFANKEPDEKRIWFYSSKTHVAKCLHELEEIRKGKGIHPGGSRCYFKHARKNNDEYK